MQLLGAVLSMKTAVSPTGPLSEDAPSAAQESHAVTGYGLRLEALRTLTSLFSAVPPGTSHKAVAADCGMLWLDAGIPPALSLLLWPKSSSNAFLPSLSSPCFALCFCLPCFLLCL